MKKIILKKQFFNAREDEIGIKHVRFSFELNGENYGLSYTITKQMTDDVKKEIEKYCIMGCIRGYLLYRYGIKNDEKEVQKYYDNKMYLIVKKIT